MRTCEGNPSRVIAKIGRITLEWLDKHNKVIELGGLHVGNLWRLAIYARGRDHLHVNPTCSIVGVPYF